MASCNTARIARILCTSGVNRPSCPSSPTPPSIPPAPPSAMSSFPASLQSAVAARPTLTHCPSGTYSTAQCALVISDRHLREPRSIITTDGSTPTRDSQPIVSGASSARQPEPPLTLRGTTAFASSFTASPVAPRLPIRSAFPLQHPPSRVPQPPLAHSGPIVQLPNHRRATRPPATTRLGCRRGTVGQHLVGPDFRDPDDQQIILRDLGGDEHRRNRDGEAWRSRVNSSGRFRASRMSPWTNAVSVTASGSQPDSRQ